MAIPKPMCGSFMDRLFGMQPVFPAKDFFLHILQKQSILIVLSVLHNQELAQYQTPPQETGLRCKSREVVHCRKTGLQSGSKQRVQTTVYSDLSHPRRILPVCVCGILSSAVA
jgi:hypothetical protein